MERDGGGIPGRDYQPEVGGLKREGSWHGTAKRNLDLIDLALKIEGEKRAATSEEQALLSKYVGFGASAIRNEMFKVADDYLKKQNPKQLIFPQIVYEARWKALAERAAALPLEWQRSILQSTQYAHYTDEGIVRGVWSAMQRLGFTGGKVFEPGGGIGSFAMLMPGAVRSTSTFTGIEMDGPTALIARLLSPEQHMQQGDFIKRKLPANFYDAVVGNPPFAQTIILGDPDYEKYGFMLHDYFFAKSMDKLRPGGVLAFVTSKGTMDKKTDKARRFLMERADLIGAIRLPSVAFEENAGTSVVTDVIFLRKRLPGEAPAGQAWNNVKQVDTKDGPVFINEYFAEHPEMVLGQNRISGNRDDQDRRINSNGMGGEKYTVVSYDETPEQLHAKFAQAVERLPANVYSAMQMDPKSLVREVAKMDFDPSIKREGVVYLGKNGDLLRVEEGTGKALSEVVKLSAKDTAWLKSYVGVRDLVQAARLAQVTDGDWKGALKKLNAGYDAFVKQHGPVNKFRVQMRKSTDEDGNEIKVESRVFLNRRLFREDYAAADVTSLETIDEDGNFKKSPFLLDRTIGKPVVRKVETIGDSLAVSLDSLGALDLDDVANRLKITRAEAIEALGKQVYQTPDKQWLLADEYLSGNVVDKLAEAIEAARLDPDLTRNVEALKEVQPEKLGPSQISVKLGAAWVQAQHVNDFSGEIGAGDVTFDSKTETWQVAGGRRGGERGSRSAEEWGTASRSPSELLEGILNSKAIKIMKAVASDSGKGTKDVLDPEATTAAQEMAKKIKDKFRTWVWTDSGRAADLVEAFNERFNNIAGRRFDGSHLTLPGVSLRFTLHPHQLRAIWRQIQTGNTYLAHAVGAGKTIEMIAGAMEQKRLGLINKPMFVVPNHMLEQFSNEFMELYPLANIMVADDQNFSKERRKSFIAAATMNAPDAIVITHDAFQRISVKKSSVAPIRDALLMDLEEELAATAKDSGARVRRGQLEQQIEQVNQRFDSILAAGKKDGIVDFEDMGVDMIYGDEAHVWRKLDFHTAQSIKGIDPNGSKRALDMYVKTQHLNSQRPGRAFVFASGTPVTNTMGELYTIMRFFAPDELARSGITTFDSWARMFGEVAAALEPNAAGKYESVERFAKFDNVPELMSRVRAFMDVLQSDQLGAIVKRPDMKGGKPNLNLVQPTAALKRYQEEVLSPRLVASRAWKPSKDQPSNPDPVINIITDGRFAAADPRFIPGANLKEGEQSKLDLAADKIIENYKAIAGNTYNDRDGKPMAAKGGTQIVFYNVGFGDGAAENRGFSARDALTKRLTAGGIPRAEIAWFDDANTDAKKEAIFKGMRNGTYKVMAGSAKKMGTGVNVQNRLAVLHYMDPPWYPADVEQPHGRIIRQGNQNAEVALEWYATKGGYDSTMWQQVARKQRFIDQAFSGDKNLRSMDDLGEASLFEQAAAQSSGDPRAVMLAGLKQDVERFERLQAAHASEQLAARRSLEQNRWSDESSEKRVRTYEKALAALGGGYFRFTQGTVSGRTFEKHGELGEAIKDAFNKAAADEALKPGPDERVIAKIGALEVSMTPETAWTKDNKQRERTGTFELDVSVGGYSTAIAFNAAQLGADVSPVGLVQKVMNFANGIDSSLRAEKAALAERAIESNKLQKKIGAPFEYQGEMLDKWGELKQLEEELRAEGAAEAKEGGTTAPTQRVMLDADGRGWRILKGPYRQAKVLMVTAERVNDDGETEKQELRYDSLKDVASLQEQADQAKPLNATEDTGPEPDSLFSRGRGAGIALNDAKAVVAAIREANPSAPPIHLLDSVNKAPDKLLSDIKKASAQHDVEAAYHDGEIYVFYKNIGSIERALFVVGKHEIRHHGLRSMLGDRLGPVLMRMGMQNPALRDAARAKMKAGHANDFVTGVEEALADMPVEALTRLTGWDRIVAAFRAWARKVAERIQRMHPNLADLIAPETWTDADVALMVIRAESVSRGGAAPFRASGTAFGLASDPTQTEAFKRWFGDSKVVDAEGKPLVVYHGTNGARTTFEPYWKQLERDATASELKSGSIAEMYRIAKSEPEMHFFAAERSTAEGYGPDVVEAYLKIDNLVGSPTMDRDEAIAQMIDSGADGAVFRDTTSSGRYGGVAYVVRKSTQIKSTGNAGTFDATNPDIRFSRATPGAPQQTVLQQRRAASALERLRNAGGGPKIIGNTGRAHTPEQLAAMTNVGMQVQAPTLEERAKAIWKDAGKKLAQGMVDQFAPVKDISATAYGLLRLSKGASGAFEAMLQGGRLKLTDGVYDFDEQKRGGVLDTLLKPLGGEHHDFFRWIAANRAERLMSKGKENLFTAGDIAALKSLANGVTSFDYTLQHGERAGQKTRDRTLIYADALKTFNQFNTNVLDMAEESGLIDGEARALWENEFYVPFYRVEEDGSVAGADIKNGAVRQQAFKSLTGRTEKLNADLLDNTLMNWAHLLDAAAKNRAAKASIEAAEGMGAAEPIEAHQGKGSVWFRENGEKRWSMVNDPYLLTAITALEYQGAQSPAMRVMGAFKRALTVGVTASPFFKVRNLIRDSVQAIGTSPLGYNPAANIAQGWKLTDPKSDAYFRLLAGGGTIHFGTMLEGSEAKRVQALVESGVDQSTILNSDQKFKAFYRKFIEPGITAYNELGNRGEAINRASLYAQLKAQGMSHAEASLQARDLMDFSMQGSYASVRFLAQVVPFFNARIQGLYKLGRAAKEDPQRFSMVIGAAALTGLALVVAYGDDEDWKKREDWDRNNFWWFKVGGVAFRIPKPFEIGAIATLAERGFELAFDKEMTGARFRQQVLTLLGDNLSMNPIPQLVKPMLDVYANKDSFTGRPIETMGMERLQPAFRFNANTSMTARAISTAANAAAGTLGAQALSPLQVDHLLRGYFGWLGTFVVGAGDVLARPATGQPSKPDSDLFKAATGGMVSDLRDAPSRYVTQMYQQATAIEEAYATWKRLIADGKGAEAGEFFADNRDAIVKHRLVEGIKKAEGAAAKEIHRVELSDMSAADKRERIRTLLQRKDRIARPISEVH